MDFFSCRNLSKSFGKELVLDKVNLSFPSKGIVSIIGPSGCGKSTLFSCLLGLDEFKGEVYFKGKLIEDFSSFRNKNTGVIFQNFHLFEYLSVEENIKLFPKHKNYKQVVKMLDLENKLKMKVSLLSGGEKQRVAIARTLLKEPKIIFCDEITGSLDQENQDIIMNYLKEISKDILIINISHNAELVNKYSDHIISYANKSFHFQAVFSKDESKVRGKLYLGKRDLFNHSVNLMHKSNFKIALSILSLVISFCLCGIILSMNRSLKEYFEMNKTSCLDYNFMELSKTSSIKIENTSFVLVKQTRPDNLDEIRKEIKGCTSCYNYSNLINSYTSLRSNNEDIRVNFYPTESDKITNYKKVIINSKMEELLTSPYIHYINNRSVDYITNTNQIISDNINLDIVFEVVDVNREMDLFQEPVIYYSYSLVEKYLSSIHLTNFSNYIKSSVSLKERIARYYYEGDFYNTGSIYLRANKKVDVEKTIKKVSNFKNEDYSYLLSSRSLNNFEAYNSLLDSIVNVIEIFLVLSVFTSIALLVLTINSLIIDEEKEIGVFKGLGVLDKQVFNIITNQVKFIIFFSLALSTLLRLVSYLFLSFYFPFLSLLTLKNVLYENLIITIFTLIVVLLLVNISKILVERINIAKVLKED